MGEQTERKGLGQKLRGWFRRRDDSVLLVDQDHDQSDNTLAPRGTFLRPWARNEAAIMKLQEGFTALTDLMGSVRDHLERQSVRQDELLRCLSHLPEALQSIPESNRVNTETLQAIHQHLATQSDAQDRLTNVLDKIGDTSSQTHKVLDELRSGVDGLNQHDLQVSQTLSSVGSAMQTVSRQSENSTQVLQDMKQSISEHDDALTQAIHRQNKRFAWLLAVVIVMAIAALGAVGFMGYVMLTRMH